MNSIPKIILSISLLALSAVSYGQQVISEQERQDVSRILNTLAADDMRGRSALTKDIEPAADFIAAEMKRIGLSPYAEQNYRQTFQLDKISPVSKSATINKQLIPADHVISLGNHVDLQWDNRSSLNIVEIKSGDDFAKVFREHSLAKENTLVLVDPSFESYFVRFGQMLNSPKFIEDPSKQKPSIVYLLTAEKPQTFQIHIERKLQNFPLFNVAGIIPGKSKPNEYVIFSGHYDHIGILKAVGQDSIANGADDDASGVTAMLTLADYYKKQNNNERTLIFVAFTAEELGMYGSKYFSNHINADQVVAMINMEMIGKDSKFGPNTVYITGYDQSNLGELMQENLKNTNFRFYPDPYTKQNLFYRSDNAVLAAKGVPAHSFSTSQMDKDEYYHTVKDEVSTLNVQNIISSIEAIAIGTSGIVTGKQTPSRVEKLKD
ncbi:M20/M25/M40 family metallo-hydrolase [Sphingobacterium multivorum]|uniref:M20/M25/M40 family metallo-hydrolase n=1 Tax=Sphingobacterium multivorum TaxID=28454 RepID=UPI00191A0E81|nr:M20/M25/M40 family metallo-hydrolase [Sphingobacterium multivorum]QQT63714.1 M20/M25/M40 family metallo-hydrolase [Sphingobacterium multivorum]